MRYVSLWNEVLGVEKTVFESVDYDQEQDLLVARVRPTKRARGRCGRATGPVQAMTAVMVGGSGGRYHPTPANHRWQQLQ